MDSVTQFSLGAALAIATMGKQTGKRAIIFGGIIATLPDLDSFVPMGNVIDQITYHRGFSHSLFVLTALSPILTWVCWHAWPRLKEQVSFRRLFFTVFICLFTHPLLDSLTTYGTQLFWPMTMPPLALPSIFIIDPLYTGLLLFGIVGFWRLSKFERWKRNNLMIALSCLYLLGGITSHFLIKYQAAQSPFFKSMRLHISPTPFNLIFWNVTALDKTSYHTATASLFSSCTFMNVQTFPRGTITQHPQSPLTKSLKRFEWFTNEFYSYSRRPPNADHFRYVISDIRIGKAPYHPFSFEIGSVGMDDVGWYEKPYRLKQQSSWAKFRKIYLKPLKCGKQIPHPESH